MHTITEVTRRFDISTRTLRYYEQIGLLPSQKNEDYAYRMYDEASVQRLQQILILRKLRLSLKQISVILSAPESSTAVGVIRDTLCELDRELTALTTVRSVLRVLLSRLSDTVSLSLASRLTDDDLQSMLALLAPAKKELTTTVKEEPTMDTLNQADNSLNRLQDKDVRILFLPPYTVAAAHYIGADPEDHASEMLKSFVKSSDLMRVKPDARVFGFNHPNPREGQSEYGYEFWVTIPEDMEVPAPLTKQRFPGGLYAAHAIRMGDFHEWGWLWEWVKTSDKYEDGGVDDGGERMNGLLEEDLNYVYNCFHGNPSDECTQLDLLYPIKPKKA